MDPPDTLSMLDPLLTDIGEIRTNGKQAILTSWLKEGL